VKLVRSVQVFEIVFEMDLEQQRAMQGTRAGIRTCLSSTHMIQQQVFTHVIMPVPKLEPLGAGGFLLTSDWIVQKSKSKTRGSTLVYV
jgi:hypothetical protein